jgi:hypothetical protein
MQSRFGIWRAQRAAYTFFPAILRWSGIMERPTLLPPFITVPLIRANIADQFHAIVKEIERGEALHTGSVRGRVPSFRNRL